MEVDGECVSLIVSAGPLELRARAMKRAFDTALAGAALVAFLPVMLIAGLAIKLGDGGPVFFVQRRLGRSNRFFQMLGFRSMRVDKADAVGNRSASLDDDRITPIGRILRRIIRPYRLIIWWKPWTPVTFRRMRSRLHSTMDMPTIFALPSLCLTNLVSRQHSS